MIAPRILLLVVLLFGIPGCRFRDPSIDLLEAEVRWREDQLYQLQDQLTLYEAQIESTRRENEALRKEVNGEASGDATTGAGLRPLTDRPPLQPKTRVPGTPNEPDADFQTPTLPEIDFGTPVEPDGDLEASPKGDTGAVRRTQEKPAGGGPSDDGQPKTAQAADPQPVSAAGDDQRIARIVLNQQLTGGKDRDGAQGDDGILVVVEPQNAAGEYVAQAAPLSVVVLDPFKSGQAAYVARWNFDTVEATALLRQSLLGRGIYLDLPWPNQPPDHSQLKLYVRYLPPDGRKLDVQKDIVVDLPARTPDRQVADTAAATAPPGDRIARTEKAASRTPPPSPNPLRPELESAKRPADGEPGRTASSRDNTYAVPPNHDPNELPPLWNATSAKPNDAHEKSVVVRQEPSASNDGGRTENAEQALRPRPWSPQR